jgi:soluble lytic murein transglycosylase-like protein
MSLTLIPALALVVVMLIPNDKETHPEYTKQAQATRSQSLTVPAAGKTSHSKLDSVQKKTNNSEAEFATIYKYIQSRYKSIKKEDAKQISSYLVEYGDKNNMDPKFAAAVIARESSFNKKAVSKTGAKGLGQIKDFNYKSLEINDPFNIRDNVKGTTRYLKEMLSNWEKKNNLKKDGKAKAISQDEKVMLALASYYKGFSAVKKENGQLDKQTNGYVKDILKYYDELITLRENESDRKSSK